MSGNSWGNNASLTDVLNLRSYVTSTLGLSVNKTAFVGASMGGVASALSIAGVGGTISGCVGMIGVSPALNLAWCYGASFTAPIKAAYGIASDGSDYATKTLGHDPMLIAAATYTGFNFSFYASPGDVSVDKSTNSDAFVTLVTATAASATVVTCTGGHLDASQFQPTNWLISLNAWCGAP